MVSSPLPDGSTAGPISVFVQLTGTAQYNADFTYANLNGYSVPTWYVNIPAGQNSTTVTLTPVKDNLNEGVETLVFTLLPSTSGNGDYLIGHMALIRPMLLRRIGVEPHKC
jgi:hypothetical protein